ncbi:hypothetical protein Mal4_11860 [Maioricimonas rarisocia]|uniref:Uncharacterized protein n=1 Tax=Maioricimonas rarisocia TaxID=2528026 RepID=A0A517Z337_9PLAN|nr:hypothetical protein Mal4_11860 [Maioricimonas rarisocia]
MGAFTTSRLLISYLRTRRPAESSGLRTGQSAANGHTVRPFCHSDVTVPPTAAARIAKTGAYRGQTIGCSH